MSRIPAGHIIPDQLVEGTGTWKVLADGEDIPDGAIVYVSGMYSDGLVKVKTAKPDELATMQSHLWVAKHEIPANKQGHVCMRRTLRVTITGVVVGGPALIGNDGTIWVSNGLSSPDFPYIRKVGQVLADRGTYAVVFLDPEGTSNLVPVPVAAPFPHATIATYSSPVLLQFTANGVKSVEFYGVIVDAWTVKTDQSGAGDEQVVLKKNPSTGDETTLLTIELDSTTAGNTKIQRAEAIAVKSFSSGDTLGVTFSGTHSEMILYVLVIPGLFPSN